VEEVLSAAACACIHDFLRLVVGSAAHLEHWAIAQKAIAQKAICEVLSRGPFSLARSRD